jgi:hypothetical protein
VKKRRCHKCHKRTPDGQKRDLCLTCQRTEEAHKNEQSRQSIRDIMRGKRQ